MTKNLTIINQFIDKSIGEWKSIRSTHTLAFQEFENSTSKIYIKHITKKNKKVVEIFENYKFSLNQESIAISIKWQATSDWDDDVNEGDETILIFLPKNENSGIILRNKGYIESVISSSNYFVHQQKNWMMKQRILYNLYFLKQFLSFHLWVKKSE